jgi:branched-chain amino acid transport system permease protein
MLLASGHFLINPDFWVGVGVTAASYGIFAVGMQLNLGTTGILNFGQTGFMSIGAYAMGILVVRAGFDFWLSLFLGILCAAAAGFLIGLASLRLRTDYLAIATLAFAEVVRYIINNWDSLTGGNLGLYGYTTGWQPVAKSISSGLGQIGIESRFLLPLALMGWALLLLSALGVWALSRTPWGRVLRAIREDEDAARALGKNTFVYKLQSLSIAAALAGIAGYVFALDISILTPEAFDSVFTVFGLAIVVMGGLGSYAGVVVGAFSLMFLLDVTRYVGLPLADDKVASVRFIIVGLVLILVVAFRPQGLLGKSNEIFIDD